jgi:hypothetical protein
LTPCPKDSFKKVARTRRCNRDGASDRNGASPSHLALRICFGFYVRSGTCACHLRIRALRSVGIFFVTTTET